MNDSQNKNDVLLLTGPLKETIWGSNYFNNELHLTSNNSIGEMWSCSGYDGFSSIIKNGEFKGKTLNEVYQTHKELFNDLNDDKFPILVKIISTSDKLSIQVHPDDEYALRNENSVGKTECWLVLDKKDNSKLILGNNASNKEELISMVNNNQFDELINEVDVEIGDFYVVNPGTIHGIGKDLLILEIQQSSDITYRFYDYNRIDKNGNLRELHIKKALEVTKNGKYQERAINVNNDNIKQLIKNKYFIVEQNEINDDLLLKTNNEFMIVTSLCKELSINKKYNISYGESFIITSDANKVLFEGKGKIIITKVNRG